MPTYIDESGDTGNHPSSAPYFRLAAVWVATLEEERDFEDKVALLREQLGLADTYEFNHSRTHSLPHQRRAFLREALKIQFRFIVSNIDKRETYWGRTNSAERLRACGTDLAANLRQAYHEAEELRREPLRELVVVDDNQDRTFLRIVKAQFRSLRSRTFPDQSMTDKINFRKSSPLAMLQLADMVCGVTGDLLDGKDPSFYEMIRGRDLNAR